MSLGFALRLAVREARSGWRRLGLYMGGVALGVAALVAIGSIRAAVVDQVRAEARTLMGADLRLQSSQPFPAGLEQALDSAAAAGAGVSRQTRLGSMVLAPRTGATRLLQVIAVEGEYPYYGRPGTLPDGLWPPDPARRHALVDEAVLVQLGVSAGDTLAIGAERFEIAGIITSLAGDAGFQTAVGPRVVIPAAFLEATGLVRLGSLVRYQALLRMEEPDARAFTTAHRSLMRDHHVSHRTAEANAERMTAAVGRMGRFLALVGLAALLLGGVGVASAVGVFVKERLVPVAVLRCLGATRRTVLAAYLLQTGMLALAGALLGAALGLGIRAAAPALLGGLLPVDLAFAVHWPSILAGVGTGLWVAIAFALLPLEALREATPLQALRRDAETAAATAGARARRSLVVAALAASVLLAAAWQADDLATGAAFAAGIGVALVLLRGVATLLIRSLRRLRRLPGGFALRQGAAGLFRPRNQTATVTVAIGFGIFLLATLQLVERNLVGQFRLEAEPDRPNLLLFDIQSDQVAGVRALLADAGIEPRHAAPVVPARLAAVNGRTAAELARQPRGEAPGGWALRREYRNTYRAEISPTERVIAGAWWSDAEEEGTLSLEGRTIGHRDGGNVSPAPGGTTSLPRISLEEELAAELGIGVGDRVTWDVQGVPIETRVANLRQVDWARFAPNFFVVFEPGVLENAPQSMVMLLREEDAAARAAIQRDLVAAFPNVSALDLAQVQEAVERIVGSAATAARLLALFSLGAGLVVLAGALAGSRRQRVREAALLKTLGASAAQIRGMLLTEFLFLGLFGGLAGAMLAAAASWLLVTRIFEFPFTLSPLPLLALAAAAAALAALIGALDTRGVLRRPPLESLREATE